MEQYASAEQIISLINNTLFDKTTYNQIISLCDVKKSILHKQNNQFYIQNLNKIWKNYMNKISNQSPLYDFINNSQVENVFINIEENQPHGLLNYDYDKYHSYRYYSYNYKIVVNWSNTIINFRYNIDVEKQVDTNSDDEEFYTENEVTLKKSIVYDGNVFNEKPIQEFFNFLEWDLETKNINEFKKLLNELYTVFDSKYKIKWTLKN